MMRNLFREEPDALPEPRWQLDRPELRRQRLRLVDHTDLAAGDFGGAAVSVPVFPPVASIFTETFLDIV
jgi:hypothetical protein